MNRRTVLTAAGVGVPTAFVGCLGDDPKNGSNDDDSDTGDDDTAGNESNGSEGPDEYEQCMLVEIEYEWLPERLRDEVDAALEDGVYETDRLLFAEAVDPERSFLVHDDTPYEPIVERDDDEQTLEFQTVEVVKAPDPRTIEVTNGTASELDVTIELTDEGNGDELLVDETVSLEPEERRDIEATDRFGRYELTIRTDENSGIEESSGFGVSDSGFDGRVEVLDDEIHVSQSVADLEPCPWENR